ncbi:hypothetical protein ACFL96_09810 [Thermoproteota archaeon]
MIVEFSINNKYIGFFKLRAPTNFDKPSNLFLDYGGNERNLRKAIGENSSISAVTIIYDIYQGDTSVVRGATSNSGQQQIISISKLVTEAEELERYTVKKLTVMVTITISGEISEVIAIDFLEELRKKDVNDLFFIKSFEKHSLTLKSEVKDPGWIETEILSSSRKVGAIRIVGDPFFKDARMLYVKFEIYDIKMMHFYKLKLDMVIVDTDSRMAKQITHTILPGKEFIIPGNVTLNNLGITDIVRVKSFDITLFTLTLENSEATFTVNATEIVGVISLKVVAGPTLISDIELKSSRELGNGWFYWQIAVHATHKLKNVEILFSSIDDYFEPVFVKVVSYTSNEIRDKTLLLDVLGLFDNAEVFFGNITVRIVLDNYEIRDYSLKVRSEITQTVSQTVVNIAANNITGVHLSEILSMDIQRKMTLLRYGLIPEADELELKESLERLQKELENLAQDEDYIEFIFPINQTVEKYDYVTLSYQYDLELANNRAVEIRYSFDSQDEGYNSPLRILGTSLDDILSAEYWISSFQGTRYIFSSSGNESMTIGYVSELYNSEGQPINENYLKTLNVRFLNAKNLKISNVTIELHKVEPPEIEFPYAYSDVVLETFASQRLVLQKYLERSPFLWLLFIVSTIIISYNIISIIRSRQSRLEN